MPYSDKKRRADAITKARNGALAKGVCPRCFAHPLVHERQLCADCGALARSLSKKATADLKKLVYDHYGRRCACCGESEPMFLTIDHINGGGTKHRQSKEMGGRTIYQWIRNHGFPSDFRVLCYNCNAGRYLNGGECPHVIG